MVWEAAVALECAVCKAEHKCRARVLDLSTDNEPHADPTWAEAPYIHPFNVPKYMAAALRSMQFARAKKRQILWVCSAFLNVTSLESLVTPVVGQKTIWLGVSLTHWAGWF